MTFIIIRFKYFLIFRRIGVIFYKIIIKYNSPVILILYFFYLFFIYNYNFFTKFVLTCNSLFSKFIIIRTGFFLILSSITNNFS